MIRTIGRRRRARRSAAPGAARPRRAARATAPGRRAPAPSRLRAGCRRSPRRRRVRSSTSGCHWMPHTVAAWRAACTSPVLAVASWSAPLGEARHDVVVPVHGATRADQPAHQLVVDRLGGPADVQQTELAAVRVDLDVAAERDRAQLVAQADAERRDAVRGRDQPDQLAGRGQPGAFWSSWAPIAPPITTRPSMPSTDAGDGVAVVGTADGEVDPVHPVPIRWIGSSASCWTTSTRAVTRPT